MKKWIVAAAVAASVISMGGPAFAGERGGNGEFTPINDWQAGSICAFSGLEDGSEGEQPFAPGNVQGWGPIVQSFATTEQGVSEFTNVIHEEGPGTSCRGFASQP
ncbi:MAG TPA: hypothetical protein VE505_20135 [Vicinamibacterales bacterium]|jgi:hypothetical protein|nr:hypothetical protein [Vicinamibacterales bacterium]